MRGTTIGHDLPEEGRPTVTTWNAAAAFEAFVGTSVSDLMYLRTYYVRQTVGVLRAEAFRIRSVGINGKWWVK